MERTILSKNQVYELVLANRYSINKKNNFLNLAFPDRGGQIDLILKTAEVYGFRANKKKCVAVFDEIVGRSKDFANSLSPSSQEKLSAVLQIKGDYVLASKLFLKSQQEDMAVNIFVFYETLVNQRHRIVAKKLIEKKAVTLFPGCDDEYLYEALSDMIDNHLYETMRRLGKGLPIYYVEFDSEGSFTIEEMGKA